MRSIEDIITLILFYCKKLNSFYPSSVTPKYTVVVNNQYNKRIGFIESIRKNWYKLAC